MTRGDFRNWRKPVRMPLEPDPEAVAGYRDLVAGAFRDRPVTIALPWPPSANTYWRHVGPRVLISARGLAYRRTVAGEVLVQKAPAMGSVRLAVAISAYPPDRRRRDLDNLLKALLDALQAAGIYADDEQIDDLSVLRMPVEPPGRVAVTLRPMTEDRS